MINGETSSGLSGTGIKTLVKPPAPIILKQESILYCNATFIEPAIIFR